jgi:hypothetical protein
MARTPSELDPKTKTQPPPRRQTGADGHYKTTQPRPRENDANEKLNDPTMHKQTQGPTTAAPWTNQKNAPATATATSALTVSETKKYTRELVLSLFRPGMPAPEGMERHAEVWSGPKSGGGNIGSGGDDEKDAHWVPMAQVEHSEQEAEVAELMFDIVKSLLTLLLDYRFMLPPHVLYVYICT